MALAGKIIFFIVALSATGCGLISGQDGPPRFRELDPNRVANAIPRVEPKSRYGNPPSYVVHGRRYHVLSSSRGYVRRGLASWYGRKFHGKRTSSREVYDMYAMTAAHRSLPLPTYVQVINLENRRQIIVRVNDRGPFHPNRIIDLSYAAAVKLGIARKGTAHVEVRAIDPAHWNRSGKMERSDALAPASTLASTKDNLYLQVAALTSQTSAQRLKTRLRAAVDSPVRIIAVPNRGRTLYRVQLGPLTDMGHVDRLGGTLAGLGFHNPRIHAE